MYKRLVFWLLAGGALLGASSCYKDVMDMDVDPITPKLIVPVIRDTLSVKQLLEREGEATTFEYAEDGTCVAVYRETKRVTIAGTSAKVTRNPSMEGHSVDVATEKTKLYACPWNILGPASNVKAVTFKSAKSFTLNLRYVNEGANNSTMLTGKVKWGSVEKTFSIAAGQETPISIMDALGVELPFKNGEDYNKCPISFSDLQLQNVTSGDEHIQLSVKIDYMNLEIEKAVGHTLGAGATDIKENISRTIDIFGTMLKATATLPESEIRIKVKKDPAMQAVLSVGAISSAPKGIREDGASPVAITNMNLGSLSEEQKKSTLYIGNVPNDLGNEAEKILVLNKDNSNVSEAFGKAMFNLNIEDITLSLKSSTSSAEDKELPLNAFVEMDVEARIPFYGVLTTSKMVSEMTINDGSFPEDVKDYTDAASLEDAIVLRIGIYNNMPLEGFAKLEFLDRNRKTVMELTVEGKEKQEGVNLFIPSGEVDNEGRVTKPAFLEHNHRMNQAKYDLLSKNAKYLRTTYYFRTSDVASNKNVRVKKTDYVLLQIAADVSAHGKPMDLYNKAQRLK